MKKGLKKVGYAPLTVSETSGTVSISYDNVIWLESKKSGGREVTAEPEGEISEVYADSMVVYSELDNSGYTINVTLLALIDDVAEAWLGDIKDANGVGEFADQELPKFALLVIDETVDKVGETAIYPYCYVSKRPSETSKTKENGAFDPEFPQFELKARPNPATNCVKFKKAGKVLLAEMPAEPVRTSTAESATENTTEQL